MIVFQGPDGIVTRVVCGYNTYYNKKKQSQTSYQQQRRYFIQKEKDRTCPRKRLREDPIKQLPKWRENGDRLIVCMDTNKNIYSKAIGKTLTKADGLGMKEAISSFAVWHMPDVIVTGACVMPTGYGFGDPRLLAINFLISSLVGLAPQHHPISSSKIEHKYSVCC